LIHIHEVEGRSPGDPLSKPKGRHPAGPNGDRSLAQLPGAKQMGLRALHDENHSLP
jgi:hypothetical protein